MFAHLAKETEVMREWVHLERERLSQEVTRRKEETEREERREKIFLSTLTRMQDQMFSYLNKHNCNNNNLPPSMVNDNSNQHSPSDGAALSHHSSSNPLLSSQSSPINQPNSPDNHNHQPTANHIED